MGVWRMRSHEAAAPSISVSVVSKRAARQGSISPRRTQSPSSWPMVIISASARRPTGLRRSASHSAAVSQRCTSSDSG
ncbi:hypothetical protein D9M72_635140 [compost metagenome]